MGLSVGRTPGRAEVWTTCCTLDRNVVRARVLFASKLTMLHLKVLGIRQSRVFYGVGWFRWQGMGGAGESGNLIIT